MVGAQPLRGKRKSMVSTGVHRSYDNAFVRASARLRERFAAHVLAAGSWTEDVGEGLLEEMEAANVSLDELRGGGEEVRRRYDADRAQRLASLAHAWRHHHPGVPVPELQLEFFIGAVGYAIQSAL